MFWLTKKTLPSLIINILAISESQKVGMSDGASSKSIKDRINHNWVVEQKWTLVWDLDNICYEHFLKYSTDIIDMTELSFDLELVREKIFSSMSKGNWLVLDFAYIPIWFDDLFKDGSIPKHILEPKFVFNLVEGYNVFVDEKIEVNPTFRLIITSKSTLWDSNLYPKFVAISVDALKYQAEQEEKLLMKRTSNGKKDPRIILREHRFIDLCFEGQNKEIRAMLYEGIDPNCTNSHGNTGLMEAALNGK